MICRGARRHSSTSKTGHESCGSVVALGFTILVCEVRDRGPITAAAVAASPKRDPRKTHRELVSAHSSDLSFVILSGLAAVASPATVYRKSIWQSLAQLIKTTAPKSCGMLRNYYYYTPATTLPYFSSDKLAACLAFACVRYALAKAC
ncbi:hypothetical protein QAD02_017420 [Eretmocerus hayati]|uniref:Uncharacterized protein n=1 Tax=Eretmocerus hayati TaxID=131215 RepID=A0ACC2PEZ7_9HYME|nr:hypothetical protein QAD02_017420 [Eretmocerus hayati]